MRTLSLALGLTTLFLAACGAESTVVDRAVESQGNNQTAVKQTRFSLANQCYAMSSSASGNYLVKDANGSHQASAPTPELGTAYYFKPSALGKYMVYSSDEFLMQSPSTSAQPVSSARAFGDDIEWALMENAGFDGSFTLTNTASGLVLAEDADSGQLVISQADSGSANQAFNFTPVNGCTAFPEIGTSSQGDTFTANPNQPVKGFADVHNHITATTFLGGAHHGTPHHRFGVTEAVGSCEANHGQDGRLDLVANLFAGTPEATHDVVGWPTFNDWPAYNSLTHEGLYYKWFERAYKAGLRIFVTNLVENETLCTLVTQAKNAQNQTMNFAPPPVLGSEDSPCNEMNSAIDQIAYAKDLVDYVDAQEGGPGKGWLRIVTSPEQAREVIPQGKLAMVLGIEISHLFNCNITTAGPNCSKEKIDAELDRLYDLGVRQMFPIHEFNNAFGGNGIFDGAVLNLGNFYDTGAFWETYDCPGGENNYEDYILREPGAVMTSVPGLGNDPLTSQIIANNPGILPLYPTDENRRQCNKLGLTELGKYAFQRMMEKGIIIEVDHLELSIKGDIIDMAERQSPAYPLVSTHGAHGGITKEQVKRIIDAGGLVYPYQGTANSWNDTFKELSQFKSDKYDFAIGYGADTNGLGSQAGPRGADRPQIQYPFTLFEGSDWKGVFNSNVDPVVFDQQVSGERIFNANSEGQAHYGLKADWVEELRLEGGNEALKALYNSAEVYIQMWERTNAKRDRINP